MNEPIWGEVTHGAVFVADSHENEKNHFLEKLWSTLESEESSAPIFLMGDIFDLLFGGIKASFKPMRHCLHGFLGWVKNGLFIGLRGIMTLI